MSACLCGWCACVCIAEEVSRENSTLGVNSRHWSHPPTLALGEEPSRMCTLIQSFDISVTCLWVMGLFQGSELNQMALDKLQMGEAGVEVATLQQRPLVV